MIPPRPLGWYQKTGLYPLSIAIASRVLGVGAAFAGKSMLLPGERLVARHPRGEDNGPLVLTTGCSRQLIVTTVLTGRFNES